MPHSDLVQSLLKGLDILQLISSNPEGMRLNELAGISKLKKPTLHNLLRTLAARDFVIKDPLNRYRIGDTLLQISQAAGKNDIYDYLPEHLCRHISVKYIMEYYIYSGKRGIRQHKCLGLALYIFFECILFAVGKHTAEKEKQLYTEHKPKCRNSACGSAGQRQVPD